MEKIFELATLYDFYGELLNDHQKDVLESYCNLNLSLSEIAEEEGISRQAVHDLVKRAEKILRDYEARIHLVDKFNSVKADVSRIHTLAGKITEGKAAEYAGEITRISDGILDEL